VAAVGVDDAVDGADAVAVVEEDKAQVAQVGRVARQDVDERNRRGDVRRCEVLDRDGVCPGHDVVEDEGAAVVGRVDQRARDRRAVLQQLPPVAVAQRDPHRGELERERIVGGLMLEHDAPAQRAGLLLVGRSRRVEGVRRR